MGIGGHILGPRKLRAASRATGLELARAYRRGRYAEGVTHDPDGRCQHWRLNWGMGTAVLIDDPQHWTSCPRPNGGPQ